jgi:hypothetical protein
MSHPYDPYQPPAGSYGAPGYGAPGHGAPGYGQGGYGQAPYGVPGRSSGPLVAMIFVALTCLLGAAQDVVVELHVHSGSYDNKWYNNEIISVVLTTTEFVGLAVTAVVSGVRTSQGGRIAWGWALAVTVTCFTEGIYFPTWISDPGTDKYDWFAAGSNLVLTVASVVAFFVLMARRTRLHVRGQ